MKIQLRGLALVAVLLGALLGLHIKSLKEDRLIAMNYVIDLHEQNSTLTKDIEFISSQLHDAHQSEILLKELRLDRR